MLLCVCTQASVSLEEGAGTTWTSYESPVYTVQLAQIIRPDLSGCLFFYCQCLLLLCIVYFSVFILHWQCKQCPQNGTEKKAFDNILVFEHLTV